MNTLNHSYASPDSARRYRGIAFVIGLHMLLAWAVISGTARKTIDILKKPLEAMVIQEVIIPRPELPQVPKQISPTEPLAPKVPQMQEVTPESPQPSATRQQNPTPEPIATTASKNLTTQPLTLATTPSRAEPLQPQSASLEGEYLGKVRAMLNATKRYPTGRQASQQRPVGSVKVWFTLSRNGILLEAGVLTISNSNLLDDAALTSVRRGSYPAFPTSTWPGQEQHKFSADIEFAPASAG